MSTISRKDYLRDDSANAHEAYYRQFVTPATTQSVVARFGIQELTAALAKDKNLNNIPLKHWDALCFIEGPGMRSFRAALPIDRKAISAAGDTVTRAVLICIAKTAARDAVTQHAPAAAA